MVELEEVELTRNHFRPLALCIDNHQEHRVLKRAGIVDV